MALFVSTQMDIQEKNHFWQKYKGKLKWPPSPPHETFPKMFPSLKLLKKEKT